jgi:hypothetical protein
VFPLFFLFTLWLHVFDFWEIDVNRTKRDKEAANGTYFAFVLHSFPSSSGMHIAKYAFYGFNDIVSGGIEEDEDEDDGAALQPTAPHAKRPAEDEEEESSERRSGKTGANEESWEAFKSLLVKAKISDRNAWRLWTKSNKKAIADHGWPVENIHQYWRAGGFPFTTFKAFSGNQDPSGNRRVGVSGDKMDSEYHVAYIEMKHIDNDEVPSFSPLAYSLIQLSASSYSGGRRSGEKAQRQRLQ